MQSLVLVALSVPQVIATKVGQKGPGYKARQLDDDQSVRIVNGDEADVCEYPWQVSLQTRDGSHFCGGTLIAADTVLTAAHCLGHHVHQVAIGDHNIQSDHDNTNVQTIVVQKQIPHPQYASSTQKHDIALLKLASSVDVSGDCAGFAAMPTASLSPETECYTTGWGTLESGGSAPAKLQEGKVFRVENHQCNGADMYDGAVTGDMICAQGKTDDGQIIDACQGDSGGPLVCEENGNWIVHGATSWGYGCAAAQYPGIWSGVYEHKQWLLSELGSDDSQCSDTAGEATDSYEDVCSWYADNTPDCGNYDDDDFSANLMCCVCGGGAQGGADAPCVSSDNGAADSYGDTCEEYFGNEEDWCGKYDTDEFNSKEMCCACGGGREASGGVGCPQSKFDVSIGRIAKRARKFGAGAVAMVSISSVMAFVAVMAVAAFTWRAARRSRGEAVLAEEFESVMLKDDA